MKTTISFRSVLFFLLALSFWSCNQQKTQDKANSAFKDEIETFMLEFIETTNVPGMGFAFYSDSVGTVMSVVGLSDVEKNLPLEIGTLIPIQSTTKFFLAILTLQLIEEGRFSLASTIDQWFNDIPNGEQVTIKNLLQNTSGYHNYQTNREFNDEYYANSAKKYTRADFINAGLSSTYNPEDFGSYIYSNTNHLILAEIIEAVTAQTIGQVYMQRIFQPARMRNTYYKPELPKDTNRIINCYQNGIPIDLNRINFKSNAAGGIISTLDDMMKFAHWVLDHEYYLTMSSEIIDNFSVDGHEFRYGLGMEVITNMYGTTFMGHAGGNPGFIHEYYFSIETNEIIIFFFNKWPDEVGYQFREKLGAILQRYRSSE